MTHQTYTAEEVRGAVARGWCHAANERKEMDPDLAEAITQEILLLERQAADSNVSKVLSKFLQSVGLLLESAKQSKSNPNACFLDWRDVCALRGDLAALSAQPAPEQWPEYLKDPENVHALMLRGVIAVPTIRSMVDLRGEVPNGEDAQLARIAELQEQLPTQPAERQGEVVVEVEVTALGSDIRQLDFCNRRWWHKLPVGKHKLYLHPAAPVGVPDGMVLMPRAMVAEVVQVLRNVDTQFRATGQPSTRVEQAINALAPLAVSPSAPQEVE